ncbi:MAG TPA: TonB-dependent receptor [Bacteroidia bacterium]|jgi:iron complex outermembrane receptor protein|nr:TonB-dependent receptor [Bacteroidia bacterium]
MKKFVSFLLFHLIVYYNPAFALSNPSKTTLSGKIVDKNTKAPITGATVFIAELKSGAVSGLDGSYTITNLPAIKVFIQVKYLGYKTIAEYIDLNTVSKQDFEMEPSITEVTAVVITGMSKNTEIKRSPIPIIVVDHQFLEQNLSTNIIDGISRVPGINAVTTGPNVSKPFIRGLGYNRVLTLFEGMRQEGQQWGDEHGIEVDEYGIDRIEIIKGPASLTYGSDAMAGVVNLLTPDPVSPGSIRGEFLNNYQNNNGLIGNSLMIEGNQQGFVWRARASHKMATNYQDPVDGRVYGTAFRETDASAFVGLNKQWGYSHLGFTLYDDLQEIPDGSRDSITRKFTKQISEADTFRPIVPNSELNSYNIAVLHQHVQHYRAYLNNSFIIGKGKLEVNVGYQQSIRREFSHPTAPDVPGLYLDLQTFTYDFKYHLPEWKGIESTIGLNGMYQFNENKGTEFIIPDYKQFDIGPFAFVRKSFGKLDLSGGVRYDNRSFSNTGMYVKTNPVTGFDMQTSLPDTAHATHPFIDYKHTFSGVSGSAGATYVFSDHVSVKANIARGFRAPNISEISANGVHPGTNLYQIGNPDFKPEFSLQEDIGIFLNTSHISASVELFNNTISNYIFDEKLQGVNGKDSVIVKGNQTFKFEAVNAQLYGGEVSLDIHPHPLDWLHFENALSVIYALNKGGNGIPIPDGAQYLPFIPPLHTRSELLAELHKKSKHFMATYMKVGVEFYAAQNRVFSAYHTETPTPGYTLLSAGIGTTVTTAKGTTLFRISLQGTNLGDVAYQSHLSRLKYFEPYPGNTTGYSGIYNMGRNISVKLVIPFDVEKSKN